MVLGVPLAVADVLHQLGGRVEDVLGRHQRTGFLRRSPRRACGLVRRVRFGRGREIEARLHDREFAFGGAEEIVRVLGGEALDERIRVGEQIGRAPSELQSLMRISYAVFCLKKTTTPVTYKTHRS